MRFPLSLTRSMTAYLMRQKLAGRKRFPMVLMLEPLHACNLKCVMCPQAKGLTRPKSSMEMSLFTRIIDEVCGYKPLIKLYMSGEPLLHKNIIEMIDYASNHGCRTMIHTNATLLTEEMSKRILDSSLTFLSFSFDGCTPEVYEKLRPPAKFKEVKANIERFLIEFLFGIELAR